jgi:hypothetical protein
MAAFSIPDLRNPSVMEPRALADTGQAGKPLGGPGTTKQPLLRPANLSSEIGRSQAGSKPIFGFPCLRPLQSRNDRAAVAGRFSAAARRADDPD